MTDIKTKSSRKFKLRETIISIRLGATVRKGRQAVREQAARLEKELYHYDVQFLISSLSTTVQNNKRTHAKYRSALTDLPEYQRVVEGNQELEVFVERLRANLHSRS